LNIQSLQFIEKTTKTFANFDGTDFAEIENSTALSTYFKFPMKREIC